MADVVRSVAVLGLIVLAIWGFGRFFTSTPKEPTSSVDYAQAARQVADAGAVPFEVLAPPVLPQGWRATSARLDDDRWHLGLVTSDDQYVGLEQAQQPAAALLPSFAPGSKPVGTATIAGQEWSERRASDGDITFVRTADGLTTLVTGSVRRAELEAYVASLRPVATE